MKHSVIRHLLLLSLLTAGLSFTAIPSAEAKLSKPQLKRCLLGIRIRAKGTQQFLDPNTLLPVAVPVNVNTRGKLGVRGGRATGLTFRYTRVAVRGKKVIVNGRTRFNGFINNAPGSLRVTINKGTRRANIRSGRFSALGQNPGTLVVHRVANGRISGSKRLPRKCRH